MSFLNRRIVPIEDVLPTAQVDTNRVQRYAELDGKTQPPVELIDGRYIQDGNHRFFAALRRGDKEIAVVDSDLPQDVQSRWSKMFGRKEG